MLLRQTLSWRTSQSECTEQASSSNKYFSTFTQSFCFPFKIILGENITVRQIQGSSHIKNRAALLVWFDVYENNSFIDSLS